MRKLLTLTTLTFSLMFSSVCFGEWTKLGKIINGDSVYVDFDPIKQEDGYVYYWELYDYVKPNSVGTLSAKTYNQGDCNLFRFKGLRWFLYKESMGQEVSEIYTEPDENWSYPSPDSSM